MASDYTPKNVTSGFAMEVTINENFSDIKTALDITLRKDITANNNLTSNLDFNGKKAINLPKPLEDTEPLRLIDLTDFNQGADAGTGPLVLLSGLPANSVTRTLNGGVWPAGADDQVGLQALSDAISITVDDIATAIASGAVGAVGDFVNTRENITGSERGGASYIIVASTPGSLGTVNYARADGTFLKNLKDIGFNDYQCGVVGDGVADDVLALQDCLDSLTTLEGVMEMQGGTRRITDTLFPPQLSKIDCKSGMDVSTVGGVSSRVKILYDGAGDAISIGVKDVTGKSGVSINNLDIEAVNTGTGTGIKLTGSSGSRTSGCDINVTADGFAIGAHFEKACFSNTIGRMSLKNCTTGLFIEEEGNDLTFGHVDINSCTNGITIGKTGGIGQSVIRFESLTIQNCTNPFTVLGNNSKLIEIGALYLEGNAAAMLIDAGVSINCRVMSLEYSADVNMLDIAKTSFINADLIVFQGSPGTAACLNVTANDVRANFSQVRNLTSRPLSNFNGTTQRSFNFPDQAANVTNFLFDKIAYTGNDTTSELRIGVQNEANDRLRIGANGILQFIDPATGTEIVRLFRNGTDSLKLSKGNFEIDNGAWDQPHLIMGSLHLFRNGNDLRLSIGAPTSAADGALVATGT